MDNQDCSIARAKLRHNANSDVPSRTFLDQPKDHLDAFHDIGNNPVAPKVIATARGAIHAVHAYHVYKQAIGMYTRTNTAIEVT